MIGSLTWLTAFIFLFFFAKSLGMLVAAEVLCGIPWGESKIVLCKQLQTVWLTPALYRYSSDVDHFLRIRSSPGRSSWL